MRRVWKSYRVFTSFWYRILGLVAVPLLLLGLGEFMMVTNHGENKTMPVLYLASFVIVEVLEDYWLFGGICEKNMCSMEYLKSSFQGMKVLKNALIADVIRRGIYFAVFALVLGRHGQYGEVIVLAAFADLVVTITLVITRHLNYAVMIQLAICGVASTVYELCAWGMDWIYRQLPLLCAAIGIAVAVGMIVGNVCAVLHVLRCVKRSYYETGIQ